MTTSINHLKLDLVDLLAVCFLVIGSLLFALGITIDTRALSELMQTFVDEWTPGFVIDGLLLLTVNRIIRRTTGCCQGMVGGHLRPEQIRLLQSSFADIERQGEQAIDLFYDNLFEANPGLRAMFSSSRQRQSRKFLQSLRLIVNSLDEPERSIEVLEQLGERHKGYGVQSHHYELAGGVLIATLAELFGRDFSGQMREAWQAGFGLIAAVMIQAA